MKPSEIQRTDWAEKVRLNPEEYLTGEKTDNVLGQRLLRLINGVILYAIDGIPVKHAAFLFNDEIEDAAVATSGHISFEDKNLDGNALAKYVSGELSGDSNADSLKILNAVSKFFNIVYKQSGTVYEVSFSDGALVPDWEVDPMRGDTLDNGHVGIFFEVDKEFFIQNLSI